MVTRNANTVIQVGRTHAQQTTSVKHTRALWVIQSVLAVAFLFAGGMKLLEPVADLTKQFPLPGGFMRFIGLCEVLGALGLILPGITRIRTSLTPLAAAGLVVIMSGATVITAVDMSVPAALVPLVVGLLAAFVAYSRSRS